MAYFPNGTAAMIYEETYCQRCVHGDDCAVMALHMIHNYDECNKPDSFLHALIPQDGIRIGKCRMFYEAVE